MERLLLSYLNARYGREDRRPWTERKLAFMWCAEYARANGGGPVRSITPMLQRLQAEKWIEVRDEWMMLRITMKGAERYEFAKAFEDPQRSLVA